MRSKERLDGGRSEPFKARLNQIVYVRPTVARLVRTHAPFALEAQGLLAQRIAPQHSRFSSRPRA